MYMVTALHTILPKPEEGQKKQLNTLTGTTLIGAPLPLFLGYVMGSPMMISGMHRRKTNFPAPEDKIVAVEYRQVELKKKEPVSEGERQNGDSSAVTKFESRLMENVNEKDINNIFQSAVDDGKGSIIVTPLEIDEEDELEDGFVSEVEDGSEETVEDQVEDEDETKEVPEDELENIEVRSDSTEGKLQDDYPEAEKVPRDEMSQAQNERTLEPRC